MLIAGRAIKLKTILLHILFWIIVWFFYRYFFSYNSDDTAYVIWFSSFLLPLTMAVTYVMVYILIPRFLLKKEYKEFIKKSFYLLVLTTYIITLILYGFLYFYLDMKITMMPPMSKNFTFILILVMLVVGTVSSIRILDQNFKTISRNKELQNKILAAQLELKEQELLYLKSQIHPHFLFNTLNTIYGMAIKQSKQTPELILRLSNLLDYILYQISKPRVTLKEEILHIEEYLELERIRFKDTLLVNINYGEIGENIEIAPMLLIPFVENAFKHGSIVDGYLKIDIDAKVEEDSLFFWIRNTTLNYGNSRESGIGLDNTVKRLDLHYADNYELSQKLADNIFEVKLVINNLGKISDA